ncbi:MAG: hypothetical protein U0935_06855 [Pirellulales bacterium]
MIAVHSQLFPHGLLVPKDCLYPYDDEVPQLVEALNREAGWPVAQVIQHPVTFGGMLPEP